MNCLRSVFTYRINLQYASFLSSSGNLDLAERLLRELRDSMTSVRDATVSAYMIEFAHLQKRMGEREPETADRINRLAAGAVVLLQELKRGEKQVRQLYSIFYFLIFKKVLLIFCCIP